MSKKARKPLSLSGVDCCWVEGQKAVVIVSKKDQTHRSKPIMILSDEVVLDINKETEQLSVRQNPRVKKTSMVGTTYVLLQQAIEGVTQGHKRQLQLMGVGFRAKLGADGAIDLSLGHSHPVSYRPREGVETTLPTNTEITVKGVDLQAVGQTMAELCLLRKPNAYQARGIRRVGQVVVLKETKKSKTKK